jgi:hypothetical protein
MNQLGGVLLGLLLVAIAVVGLLRKKAFLGGGLSVNSKKEPFGFWLAIIVQPLMGLFAVIYSLAR